MRKLVVVVLHHRRFLRQAVDTLIAEEAAGVTTMETYGLLHTEKHRFPLFGGARRLIQGDRHHSKTLFAIARDPEHALRILDRLESDLELGKPGRGIAYALPVEDMRGLVPVWEH